MGRKMLSIRAIKAVAGCLAGILLTLPMAGLSSLSLSLIHICSGTANAHDNAAAAVI